MAYCIFVVIGEGEGSDIKMEILSVEIEVESPWYPLQAAKMAIDDFSRKRGCVGSIALGDIAQDEINARRIEKRFADWMDQLPDGTPSIEGPVAC